MGTDNHLYLAAGNGVLLRLTRFAFLLTSKPADFNTERFKPAAEVVGMLLSEQFGRRHQCYLFAVGNGT